MYAEGVPIYTNQSITLSYLLCVIERLVYIDI